MMGFGHRLYPSCQSFTLGVINARKVTALEGVGFAITLCLGSAENTHAKNYPKEAGSDIITYEILSPRQVVRLWRM